MIAGRGFVILGGAARIVDIGCWLVGVAGWNVGGS
jgi:hypothetical protein